MLACARKSAGLTITTAYMLKVGLTGGIGSGKSTVARVFEVLEVPVFRADDAAKALMEADTGLKAFLAKRFGSSIYRDGKLDRAALASIIFADPDALEAVNGMVHPVVRRAFDTWASEQRTHYVIMEAALMAENDGWRRFDRVITVSCPEPERIRRVMARDQVTEEQVRARMRNQATEEARLSIAHHVIVSDGSRLIIPQVLAIHERLLQAIS